MAAVLAAPFQGLVEGDEVQRFFEQMLLPATVRAGLSPESASHFPSSLSGLLAQTKEIWREKGLLSPAELRVELLERCLVNASPEVRETIRQIELSRNTPEATTGYLNKEHGYIASGLAHLYARETGRAVALAEIDFSNMGGTNDEFARRIAAERGVPVVAVEKREAELLTDLAVKVIASGMTGDLAGLLPEGARIIPIRTGGDELRILFDGVDDPRKLKAIENALHAKIEERVADMGLQDHPHLKDPDNPERNGFGAALTIEGMRDIKDPDMLVQRLDARIKYHKEILGQLRLGRLDKTHAVLEINREITQGTLVIPEGMNRDDFIQQQLFERTKEAQETAQTLRERNPQHNKAVARQGVDGFRHYCEDFLSVAAAGKSPIVFGRIPKALEGEPPIGGHRPDGVPPMATMARRRYEVVRQHLEAQGKGLDAAEGFFLRQSVNGLTPVDPSAQVQMPKDMVRLAEAYAVESREFIRQFDREDPRVKAALARAGLATLEEVKPQGMGLSLHGLASANNALGHHNADVLLRHVGGEVVRTAFEEAGLPHDARTPYVVAHHGGGNFTLLVQPGVTGQDGSLTFVSPKMMQEVQKSVARQVSEMNALGVQAFLEQKGATLSGEMRRYLAGSGLDSLGDMQDSKTREARMEDGTVVSRRLNGVMAASAVMAVETAPISRGEPFHGGVFIGGLRHMAEKNLDSLRADRVLNRKTPEAEPISVNGGSPGQVRGGNTPRTGEMSIVAGPFEKLAEKRQLGLPPTQVFNAQAQRPATKDAVRDMAQGGAKKGIDLSGFHDVIASKRLLADGEAGEQAREDPAGVAERRRREKMGIDRIGNA